MIKTLPATPKCKTHSLWPDYVIQAKEEAINRQRIEIAKLFRENMKLFSLAIYMACASLVVGMLVGMYLGSMWR